MKYPESTNIVSPFCIDKYINRLAHMKNLSLIEFIANYDYHTLKFNKHEVQRTIFDDVMYRNEVYPNEHVHLFLTGGVGIGNSFFL